MPHFFIESNSVNNNTIKINDKENYRHIARALRSKIGESLLLIDEKQTQYETTITDITTSEILCTINNRKQCCHPQWSETKPGDLRTIYSAYHYSDAKLLWFRAG